LALSPSYTEQTILNIRSGSEPTKKIVIIQTSLGKRKINIVTHRRLEKFFPDWEGRIAYQKNREKVYKAAMIKRREVLRLRKKEDSGRTKDEQDAIDYFLGRDFYQTHQDPSVKPNIFDNRQSFLIKMHNKEMRMNFLKSFNKRHTLIPENLAAIPFQKIPSLGLYLDFTRATQCLFFSIDKKFLALPFSDS
jgi:hypothetical protein